MLVKGHIVGIPKIYWIILIPIFLWVSYYNIFLNWDLQHYGVTELEDFGRYVFVLCLSFCQCFIYILFIRLAVITLKFIFRDKKTSK